MMVYETVCDGIDLNFMNESDEENEDEWIRSVSVKYFNNDLSLRCRLRRLFVRNPSTRLGFRIVDLLLKLMLCFLYIARVILDDPTQYQCQGHHCAVANLSLPVDSGSMKFSSTAINWYVLLWVHRDLPLWIAQVLLSTLTLIKAVLDLYVNASKGTCLEKAAEDWFGLELICSIPFLFTAMYPPILMNLYIPSFLNVWLVKRSLEKLFNDLHLTKQRFQTISVTLSQQLFLLVVTLMCLIFTTICGIQHIQRGSSTHSLTMFESFYFVIVTFSTVGYGDIAPDNWLGQLFMTIMICLAFAFIPRQIEGIHSTWKERKKTGGEYNQRRAAGHRHVVVCAGSLHAEDIMDFLFEFYAHPKLEDHIVVLLSPEEKGSSLQMILKDPKWAHRVIYMRGSALKDVDLKRCRLHEADACFILTPTMCSNRDEADQHTILRSWAVKDFAPKCRQYIQLFKTEYKLHVKFAEHVVCEDEFKYALLANNCLYPALSTLVTLLLHSTSGEAGLVGQEPWQQAYGRSAGNEVYHIKLCNSAFFKNYEGKNFTSASADAHRRFGVCLVAILDITKDEPRLQLNPGNDYPLKSTDYCFYIGEFKEEYSKIIPDSESESQKPLQHKNSSKKLDQISEVLEKLIQQELETEEYIYGEESVFNTTITCQWGQEIANRMRRKSLGRTLSDPDNPPLDMSNDSNIIDPQVNTHMGTDPLAPRVLQVYSDMGQDEMTTGPPPMTLYSGNRRTLCHLMKSERPACCLKWGEDCEHCTYKNAKDERWQNQLIILAAEQACAGIHNFIVPLRSHFISRNSLSPIILLLHEAPDDMFLDTIGQFPLVYWMKGKITSIDDLLLAGINKVSHLIIVNRETMADDVEETMVDSETIVAVQTILKLFPNTNIITELSQATNIRFMQFQANDEYARKVSKLEKNLNQRMSSTLSHIFRLPFAAGQVFSASMLNSLLYQTFVKGYLITFVRLLLGIDAEENSGHLSSVRVKSMTLARYPTYGELYNGMATTTGEIPIAIYRTEKTEVAFSNVNGRENNNEKKGSKPTMDNKRNKSSVFPKAAFLGVERDQGDLAELVRNRLHNLGMKETDYTETDESVDVISYVILNPTPKRRLRVGDIVYVIQPSSMAAIPSNQRWNMAKAMFPRQSLSRKHSNNKSASSSPSPTFSADKTEGGDKSLFDSEEHVVRFYTKPSELQESLFKENDVKGRNDSFRKATVNGCAGTLGSMNSTENVGTQGNKSVKPKDHPGLTRFTVHPSATQMSELGSSTESDIKVHS